MAKGLSLDGTDTDSPSSAVDAWLARCQISE